jgi:NodT family efflux transporter outer membrane factor (OMF) lipoprotein
MPIDAFYALRFAAVAGIAFLSACTLGPNFVAPQPKTASSWVKPTANPDPAFRSQPVADGIDPEWWRLLGDPLLTSLEHRAAIANFDVREASMRLAESRAEGRATASDQYPDLSGAGSFDREEPSAKGLLSLFAAAPAGGHASAGFGGGAGGVGSSQFSNALNLWQYGFDASWELDLWGRVRRQVESAQASTEESAELRRDVLLSSLAEVARDYVSLRGLQCQRRIAQDDHAAAQQVLDVTQSRAEKGLAPDLDVANAAAEADSVAAQLPALDQQIASQINALSFLLAEPPGALSAELSSSQPVPPTPPRVPVGVPSDLARRRPDIRAAEAALHAATADIGVAQADFYPSITLNGSVGIQALNGADLGTWGARQYDLGPAISIPIFEGGRLHATLALRKASQQEAAFNYQKTVLQAWHEVDDALTAYRSEQDRNDQLRRQRDESARALSIARIRYQDGVGDFLSVLDAERVALQAEQDFVTSNTNISLNLIQLYKALGGGWETTFPRT